jgi:hypothetical protein
LIAELENRQETFRQEKITLQESIMNKKGVDDDEDWKQLQIIRESLEQLYEEKLLSVQKMYNMTQNFLKEQKIHNEELNKRLENTKGGSSVPAAETSFLKNPMTGIEEGFGELKVDNPFNYQEEELYDR